MKYILWILGGIIATFFVIFGAGRSSLLNVGSREFVAGQLPQNENLSLVTEPADGIAPVLAMIRDASTSIDLVMYEVDDRLIEDALVAAKDRGVAVRALLSRGYYGEPSKVNGQAYQYFQSKGIAVKWTPAYFALTHEKTLIVDHDAAMIMTFNFMPQYYATSRDFGVVDVDRGDVDAIEATFNADWEGIRTTVSGARDLVWSPGSEDATVALMHRVTSTLDVYNEEMADEKIMRALEAAANRGVTVRVLLTYSSEWKPAFRRLTAAGVQVRTYSKNKAFYIHAKMILADGAEAFVGSQNFSATSQNENRELGVMLTDRAILKSLSVTFGADWENVAPFVTTP